MKGNEATGVNQIFGDEGEKMAFDFFSQLGYKILETKFSTRWGEIDLIVEDSRYIIFVEVKRRRHREYGYPEESITTKKIEKLTKAAFCYLKKIRKIEKMIRFDVISIENNNLRHIPHAFLVGSHFYV